MNDEERLEYELITKERDGLLVRATNTRLFLTTWQRETVEDNEPRTAGQISRALAYLNEGVLIHHKSPEGPVVWICRDCSHANVPSENRCRNCSVVRAKREPVVMQPAVDPAEDARQISPRPFMWICPTCGNSNSGEKCSCGYNNSSHPSVDYPKVVVQKVQHDETNRLKGIISRTQSALSNWTQLLEPTGDEPICAMLDQLERMLEGE